LFEKVGKEAFFLAVTVRSAMLVLCMRSECRLTVDVGHRARQKNFRRMSTSFVVKGGREETGGGDAWKRGGKG